MLEGLDRFDLAFVLAFVIRLKPGGFRGCLWRFGRSRIGAMPAKLEASDICKWLGGLREHVQENIARLQLRPGNSVREKLDRKHNGDKRFWNFFVNNEAKCDASHRQQQEDFCSAHQKQRWFRHLANAGGS